MDMEERLQRLSVKISSRRRDGHVKSWPESVKKEGAFLSSLFGIKKVSEVTGLTQPSLYSWKKQYSLVEASQEQSGDFLEQKPNIAVTRIMSSPCRTESSRAEPILSLIRKDIELKIYCADTASKLVERALK